jgi:hypothetical protein
MSVVKAIVRNGQLELSEPIDLPDGTELLIPMPNGKTETYGLDESEWSDSPEAIAEWLEWLDSLEPLIFTPEEEAALAADRLAQKEWKKAHFNEHADKLRRMWE